MAEIEITLPTVQYGNVKVRATPEELGLNHISDSFEMGVALAVFQNLFTQGWVQGSQMDVSAPVSAPQGAPEVQAQELLSEGLGGVTEISENHPDAEDYKNNSDAAPWDKPAAEVKKPWETEVTAPVVLDAAW